MNKRFRARSRPGMARRHKAKAGQEAEQAAAAALLRGLRLVDENTNITACAKPLGGTAIARTIPRLPNERFALQVTKTFMLPDWATSLIC